MKILTQEEKTNFSNFFAEKLYQYIQKHNLSCIYLDQNSFQIERESSDIFKLMLLLKGLDVIDSQSKECRAFIDKINPFTCKVADSSLHIYSEEKTDLFQSSIKENKLYMNDAADFYLDLYKSANTEQRRIIASQNILYQNLEKIINALYLEPEILYDFAKNYIVLYAKETAALKKVTWIKKLKDSLPTEKFNDVLYNFFSVGATYLHAEKDILLAKYLVNMYINDTDTRDKIRNLISNELPQEELFITEDNMFFDITVNQKKLKNLYSLPTNHAYEQMHKEIVEILKKYANSLDALSIYGEKNSKENYTINVKTTKNTCLTKESFQKILLKTYQIYVEQYISNSDFIAEDYFSEKVISYIKLSHETATIEQGKNRYKI